MSPDKIENILSEYHKEIMASLKDVKDSAEILIRSLKLYRNMANKVKFKDSFKG